MPFKSKEQQREYQRQWMAKRRRGWIDANGPCVRCSSDKDLEVNHKNPDEKVSHRVWSWSEARRMEELSKCEVLCEKCHKNVTRSQQLTTTHGSRAMYDHHMCRCDVCQAAKRVRNAQRYKLA